jgi:hypothetical protein
MRITNPKPGKEDTPMRASEALTYEPAACWQRLQATKSEFFFEDLDQLMKERHRQFLEELMGYERQCFLNVRPYERAEQRVDQANGFYGTSGNLCGNLCVTETFSWIALGSDKFHLILWPYKRFSGLLFARKASPSLVAPLRCRRFHHNFGLPPAHVLWANLPGVCHLRSANLPLPCDPQLRCLAVTAKKRAQKSPARPQIQSKFS